MYMFQISLSVSSVRYATIPSALTLKKRDSKHGRYYKTADHDWHEFLLRSMHVSVMMNRGQVNLQSTHTAAT